MPVIHSWHWEHIPAIGTMADPIPWALTYRHVIPKESNLTHSLTTGGLWESPHPLEQTKQNQHQNRRVSIRHPDPQFQSHVFWWKKLQKYRDDTALLPQSIPALFLREVKLVELQGSCSYDVKEKYSWWYKKIFSIKTMMTKKIGHQYFATLRPDLYLA